MKLQATIFIALAGCSAATVPVALEPAGNGAGPTVAAPRRFDVDVFVRGTSKRYNPDPIVAVDKFIFVAYQNATGPTGTGGDSTIVQYKKDGSLVRSIRVPGRCDGMRWNPYTKLMWITVNEDANSSMFTWDPSSNKVTHYSFSSAKHGGGYDDLAFSGGQAFIAASNPKLSKTGVNKGPAVVSVALSGSTAQVTPVLMGDAKAKDIPSGKTVTLNLTDPDSMTVAPNGDVALISQADGEIVWLHGAGKKSQSASRLLAAALLDDTVYSAKGTGTLYVVDQKKNAVYTVQGRYLADLYTEVPGNTGVYGFVGIVNQSTGSIKPVLTGFGNPTGLVFVPSRK
ncbi:MAG TPA: hypothetical protein VMT95_12295 [Candidatus Binatia bacterium]|nr:hypothetical protein [Candidatus Binatia bacterium]